MSAWWRGGKETEEEREEEWVRRERRKAYEYKGSLTVLVGGGAPEDPLVGTPLAAQ